MAGKKFFQKGTTEGMSRRRFVQGLMAGGIVAGLGSWSWPALALNTRNEQTVLRGNHFNLALEEAQVNYTGWPAIATAINGSIPGPLLRMREGDSITISVTNRLRSSSSVHWHGFRIPADMDGVPALSYPGIDSGQTFVYRFKLKQSGTYWYHSHTRFQEQTGLYGPLIIEPAFKDQIEYDREHVVMLSDWTDQDPEIVFANLKQQSDYYNFHQLTIGDFFADAHEHGLGATVRDRLTWGEMNMSPTDILDVTGNTYTYLLNGRPPAANWTGLFRPGDRVRLRFINGSSMTNFDVRIPGLPMTVVQSDGNDVEPVVVDEFRITVAETYDVIVQPQSSSAYTIFAQSEDRTGYARGTLATRPGVTAPVPPMDPRPRFTMVDMGMGGMPGMSIDGGVKGTETENIPGMNTGGRQDSKPAGAAKQSGESGMDMENTPETRMQHSPGMKMGRETITPLAAAAYAERRRMTGESAPGQPGPRTSADFASTPDMGDIKRLVSNPVELRLGPEVDNVAQMPTNRMSEPGVGLNNNGRRVLTYADLRAVYRTTDPRPPAREIELHLTGNMERFIWGFNGEKFSQAEAIRLTLGERVRIVLINDSMMEHPIHLHGLWSELENGHGAHRPYKHTISVKPGERLSYLVSADTPGRWAYHCHLLYHMEAGMFREVIVE
jgi:CopA family copper-resistance protein